MYVSPGLVIVFVRAVVGVPRGLYHLWNPAAYARWKVNHEIDEALRLHSGCRPCQEGHPAHVLVIANAVQDKLEQAGVDADPDLIVALCRFTAPA